MSAPGIFQKWQPEYAARGVPTFPVNVTPSSKKPTVRGFMQVGMERSARLVDKFPNANALGLACGRKAGFTVLDVDCGDERTLADALVRHGKTPFIVRTGSGNFQAWYRHSGEKRQVRPWGNDLPIDQLGSGFVVAPPSEGRRQAYAIIQGSLDDLHALPPMRNAWAPGQQTDPKSIHQGGRNDALWRHCMANARHCDTFDDLVDVARGYNDNACMPPLDEHEVLKAAQSAWHITERGDNRFGAHGSWLTTKSVDHLVHDPWLMSLVVWLQAQNGPDAKFLVADGLQNLLGWTRRKFANARKRAVETGWIVPLNKPSQDKAILYRWGPARMQSS